MEPKDEAWKIGKTMETKVLPFEMTGLDATGRTVEGYAAAFDNVDQQGDVIKGGAFKNSITQRGGKVKFLWQHDTNEPIGKIQDLREDERGLYFKAVVSDTQRGRDCLALLRDKAIDSLSIGYDALPGGTDIIKGADGQNIRTLSDIRLWEISMVTFPANEEAVVTGLKQAGPSEAKPWDVFKRGDRWAVYKVDPDGQPTGDALGTHDTEEEARAQVRALYASERQDEKPDVGGAAGGGAPVGGESGIVVLKAVTRSESDGAHPAGHYLIVEDPQEPSKWHLRVRDMEGNPDHGLMGAAWAALHQGYRGNVYEGPGKQEAIRKLRAMYEAEDMIPPGEDGKAAAAPDSVKVGRRVRAERIERLKVAHAALGDIIKWAEYGDEEESTAPPTEGAAQDSQKSQAGPIAISPTDVDALDLEILELELSLSEV